MAPWLPVGDPSPGSPAGLAKSVTLLLAYLRTGLHAGYNDKAMNELLIES